MTPHTSHTSAHTPRQAFTLIEMLVVIAIIALLISIITPATSRALASARTVACQSNMRQISAAVIAFASDNETRLPRFQRTSSEPGGPSNWAGELILGNYLDAPLQENREDIPRDSVLRCPSGLVDMLSNGSIPNDPYTETPMVHRPLAFEQSTEDGLRYVHNWYGLNARTEHGPEHGWPFIRINNPDIHSTLLRVTHADRTVMFFDGSWAHNSAGGRIYARHGSPRRTTNFAFFDGRVENMRARFHDVGSRDPETYPLFRN